MRKMLAGFALVPLFTGAAAVAADRTVTDDPAARRQRVALAIGEGPHPVARTTRGLVVDGLPLLAYADFLDADVSPGGQAGMAEESPDSGGTPVPAAFDPADFPLMDAPKLLPVPDPAMFADPALSGADDIAIPRRSPR